MSSKIKLFFNKNEVEISTPKTYDSLIKKIEEKFNLANIAPLEFEDKEGEIKVSQEDYQKRVVNGKGVKVFITQGKEDKKSQKKGQGKKVNDEEEKYAQLEASLKELEEDEEQKDQMLNDLIAKVLQLQSGKSKMSASTQGKKQKTSKVLHTGFKCTKCGVCPIKGRRYKCSECANKNYCGECREKIDHDHDFIVLTRAKSRLVSGKAVNPDIHFQFPIDDQEGTVIYELELINNGEVAWPNDISLKCLDDSDCHFEIEPSFKKLIEPGTKAKFKLLFEYEDLSVIDNGIYTLKAQLMSNGKEVSSIIKMELTINQSEEEPHQGSQDKAEDEEKEEEVKDDEFDFARKKSKPNQQSNASENQKMYMNNKQDNEVKPPNRPNYRGSAVYGPPMDNINTSNPMSINEAYNNNSKKDFNPDTNPNTQLEIARLKNDTSKKTYQQPNDSIKEEEEKKAPQQVKKNDSDDENDEFTGCQKKKQPDPQKLPRKLDPSVDKDKLQKAYTCLNKYSFEPVISRELMEDTIIENGYDLTKTINKLWAIYDDLYND